MFSSIQNKFVDFVDSIEYKWNDPKSYVVLIPGLPLMIQAVATKLFRESVASEYAKNREELYRMPKNIEYDRMLKWHGIGAVVSLFAVALFAGFQSPFGLGLCIPILAIGIFQVYKGFMDSGHLELEATPQGVHRII